MFFVGQNVNQTSRCVKSSVQIPNRTKLYIKVHFWRMITFSIGILNEFVQSPFGSIMKSLAAMSYICCIYISVSTFATFYTASQPFKAKKERKKTTIENYEFDKCFINFFVNLLAKHQSTDQNNSWKIGDDCRGSVWGVAFDIIFFFSLSFLSSDYFGILYDF